MFGQSHSIYTTTLLFTFDPSGVVFDYVDRAINIRPLRGRRMQAIGSSHSSTSGIEFLLPGVLQTSTSSRISITLLFTFDPSGVVIQLSGICYKHSIPPGSAECDQSVLHIQQLPGSYFYYLDFCRHSTSSLKSITLVFKFDLSGVGFRISGFLWKHSIPPGRFATFPYIFII
jgi:hypothetical protein